MIRSRSFSPATRMVLATLLENTGAWSYGYDLAKITGIKSGTLYPLLIRLEERGLLETEWQPPAALGRPPRHTYRLTPAGIEAAKSNPVGAAKTTRPSLRAVRT